MPIQAIKRDIKRHRPVDWFAIVILISLTYVLGSILADKIDNFSEEMDREAEALRAYMHGR